MTYREPNLTLYQGNALELAEKVIQPHSVDLIFTDPPYPKEYHYLYEWLAKEAARALKPNGFLITYAGPYWKHRVMMTLGEYLDYYYDFILINKANSPILWPRHIITGYKSALCYAPHHSKGLPRCNALGRFDGLGGDKRFHTWGQNASEARYYIDLFSQEKDLVVDYFLGGGTFAEVSKKLNRNFIGFEIDPETFALARARVDGALGPKEKGRQMELIDSTASSRPGCR